MSEEVLAGTVRAQLAARVLDISMGGALVAVAVPLKVGTVHDLALEVEGETLWVQAEVRHCRPARDGIGFQVGVQFVGIDPKDVKRLIDYLGWLRSRA